MGDELRIELHGLKDLNKALRQMGDGSQAELKAAFRDIAETVAAQVRPKVPRKTGRAAGSVKARGTTKGAAIAVGGTRAPHYPWLDFGGSTGRGHISGVPWSGSIKREWMGAPVGEGRYLYPTIRDNRDDIIEAADDAVEAAAKHAGFETHG